MTSTGVCLFVYNTEQIDYSKLALLAARYVKSNMKNNTVALVTDDWTWNWLNTHHPKSLIDEVIDEVVIANDNAEEKNIRVHHDSPWTQFKSKFRNSNKHEIIKYTPFDRTLLIDVDYIVQNHSLDYLFDSDNSVALYKNAVSLNNLKPHSDEQTLGPLGIPMFWSTVVYFDKNQEETRLFFDMWAHIKENYEFYKFLYGFSGDMYRTDFCVSIAAHTLEGALPGNTISEIADGPMIYMSQKDDIVHINSVDEWIYLVNNRSENWKDILVNVKKENVHVMNKRALDRHYDKLIGMFNDRQ